MCTFGLSGCRVKPRRPHQTGPPGLAHDSPRTLNVHISGPRRFKHHQTSTKGPQERERRKKIVAGRGKKKREILGPPLFGASTFRGLHSSGPPLFGASTLRGLHSSGLPPSVPHFFWVWASTFRGLHSSGPPPSGPHFFWVWASTFRDGSLHPLWSKNPNVQKLAEVEIGRSLKLAELEKKKLAEVEISRSRSIALVNPNTQNTETPKYTDT